MKEEKEGQKGFAEKQEILPIAPMPTGKLKKGTMSEPFEAALDAVEKMERNKKH